MTLSGGSGELEAARSAVNMARNCEATSAANLKDSEEQLSAAQQQLSAAQQQLSAAQQRVKKDRTQRESAKQQRGKAEEYLKGIETRWEVIDVDLGESEDKQDDHLKRASKRAKRNARSQTARAAHEIVAQPRVSIDVIEAVRIAIGKKVMSNNCEISFQLGTKDPYIQFSYVDIGKTIDHTVLLKTDDLEEVKYFISNEDDEDDSGDQISFIAFRIKSTELNGFTKFSRSYDQDTPGKKGTADTKKRYISVEVRDPDKLHVSGYCEFL